MKFSLVMSRTSNSETPYKMDVKDEDSGVKIELTLTAEQFAEVFTGLHTRDIEGRVMGDPSNIGKTKVRETRFIYLSGQWWEKESIKRHIEDNHQEDGWELDLYLGSQSSVIYDGKDGYTVNYAVYKWV